MKVIAVKQSLNDSIEPNPVTLPVTAAVIARSSAPQSPVLVVQHIREDTEAFLEVLRNSGWNVAGVVAIPYSSTPTALEGVRGRYRLLEPSLDEMLECISTELRRISELHRAPVMVQEVGGYLADAIRMDPSLANIVSGVVEETKQGLWRHQQLTAGVVRVIQIADSPLKKVEARYVGAAVALSTMQRVRASGTPIIGQHVGVIGYGDIGSACARTLQGMRNTVHVWDSDPGRRIAAISDGFLVSSGTEMARNCKVLVGCTGKPSVDPEWFAAAQGDIYLASGSSRQIELSRVIELPEPAAHFPDSRLALADTVRRDVGRTRLHVLREGYPVNFESISLPFPIIDLVFAQIAYAMQRVAERDYSAMAIDELSQPELEWIGDAWIAHHGATETSLGGAK